MIMVMSVFVEDGIPISAHMGIFRATGYANPHKDLAMQLHAFCWAARLINSSLKYMITKSVPVMRDIMFSTMQKNNLLNEFWIGDAYDREMENEFGAGDVHGHKMEEDSSFYPKDHSAYVPVHFRPDRGFATIDGKRYGIYWASHKALKGVGANIPTTIVGINALEVLWNMPIH